MVFSHKSPEELAKDILEQERKFGDFSTIEPTD